MRALLLTLTLFSLLGSASAFCDEGPTISGGEGGSASPHDIPFEQCRAIHEGERIRPEPAMAGGEERSPTDTSGLSDTCPGAQVL